VDKITVTHLINPVKVPKTSDLFVAQPVTFESMRRAKDFAQQEIHIDLVTAQYEEDTEIIPNYFNSTPNLTRSILDVGAFNKKRKLPLLGDLLDKAYQYNPQADYIIYTNADIALMPHFYLFVKQKIEEGYDAFVINRRTIPGHYNLQTIDLAYSEIGEKHPGFDCFVISMKLYDKIQLHNVAIGVSKVGITLIANLLAFSQKFKVFDEEHITFHIGEDKVWQNPELEDYFMYNCQQAYNVYEWLLTIKPELLENDIFKKHLGLLKKQLFENTQETEVKTDLLQKLKRKFFDFDK
jgi:hypothetical protein